MTAIRKGFALFRRPLLSPGRLALAVFTLQVLLVTIFVFSAGWTVRLIDASNIGSEQQRAESALRGLSSTLGTPLTSAAAARIGVSAGLEGAHFAARADAGAGEVAVSLPQDLRGGDGMAVLAWTPHRLGSELWRTMAPIRLGFAAMAVALMGLLLLRFKHMAEELDRRRQAARDLAVRDSLTGLANRLAFEQGLDAALAARGERDSRLALLYLDMNGFKAVNDGLGHPAGDALLREVADRIRGALRPDDLVARVGGDEFAVMLAGTGDAPTAARCAARLHAALARPYEIGGRMVSASASIGVALAPEHGRHRDELLARADRALYAAKGRPRARFVVYRPGLDRPEETAVQLVA